VFGSSGAGASHPTVYHWPWQESEQGKWSRPFPLASRETCLKSRSAAPWFDHVPDVTLYIWNEHNGIISPFVGNNTLLRPLREMGEDDESAD